MNNDYKLHYRVQGLGRPRSPTANMYVGMPAYVYACIWCWLYRLIGDEKAEQNRRHTEIKKYPIYRTPVITIMYQTYVSSIIQPFIRITQTCGAAAQRQQP